MRKLFAILTLSVALAGCDKEPNDNGMLDVSVNAPIATPIRVSVDETRAAGVDSAEGVFANGVLDSENVTMRYIMNIYTDEGVVDRRYVAYSDSTNVEFYPDLVPNRNYKFVVWADVVTKESTAKTFSDVDNHYDTTDLSNITLKGAWNAMDESRDAFTGFTIKENFTGGNVIVNLTRPFAKLRIVATETDGASRPAKGVLIYTSTLRQAFNAVTGEAATASLTGKEHTFIVDEYTADEANTMTLFADYLFAMDDKITLKFSIYEDEAMTTIINREYTVENIEVKSNCITTIKGEILSGGEVFVTTTDYADDGNGVLLD